MTDTSPQKPLVLFGGARQEGDCTRVLKTVMGAGNYDTILLYEKDISYYDHDHANKDDDFIAIAEDMVQRDTLVFLTPVYWYTMSAMMKTFFDRFTDLITIRKDLGRALKGKKCFVIAVGADVVMPPGFEYPFSGTCNYLEMDYCGSFYYSSGGKSESRGEQDAAALAFGEKIYT